MLNLIGPYPHERINPVAGQSQEKFCVSSTHQQGVFSTVHALHGDVARAQQRHQFNEQVRKGREFFVYLPENLQGSVKYAQIGLVQGKKQVYNRS